MNLSSCRQESRDRGTYGQRASDIMLTSLTSSSSYLRVDGACTPDLQAAPKPNFLAGVYRISFFQFDYEYSAITRLWVTKRDVLWARPPERVCEQYRKARRSGDQSAQAATARAQDDMCAVRKESRKGREALDVLAMQVSVILVILLGSLIS
jgi:hypothetical protein